MGINSTEVSYSFGQLGSGFCDTAGAFTPPTGKVIVGIQFLDDTSLSALVSDKSQQSSTPAAGEPGFIGIESAVANVNGSGSDAVDSSQIFPAGMTIYGRWTSVTLSAGASTGGIICYFGE